MLGKTGHAFLPTGYSMTEMLFSPPELLLLGRRKEEIENKAYTHNYKAVI